MAGRATKAKGKHYERELVALLRQQGYQAERIYASGAIGAVLRKQYQTSAQALDADVYVPELSLNIEVKFRSDYPKWLDYLSAPIGLHDNNNNRLLIHPWTSLNEVLHTEVQTCPSFPITWFLSLMQQNPILALRRPQKGWLWVRKLSL